MNPLTLAILVPILPALAAALCGLCAADRRYAHLAPGICCTAVFSSFFITLVLYFNLAGGGWAPADVVFYRWIVVGDFEANWGYYLDGLSMTMLLVVTGIGSLIAVYAAGYMEHDDGIARFFAGVSLFIFSMTTVVMADNLVLLFLGWEAVGLSSYLLIGHYFRKPSAVAAAKKAFVVNRIGDAGFALGIFCCFVAFGSVKYDAIVPAAWALLGQADPSLLSPHAASSLASAREAITHGLGWTLTLAPFGLLLGALGKSAQFPLFVWLPDAMEGPTPVSALIHAATMVTSGVYMIARTMPLFEYSPWALPTVATIGAFTALLGASIALAQNDLKRIFAYSTVSQLGYMFLAVGAAAPTAAIFHLLTHAFFKALLFLSAGNVMHALAGNLDIRTFSGLGRRMPLTKYLMLAGCLALAGFPLTSGFFSKDLILADTFYAGAEASPFARWYTVLGVVGLVTALLTAYYGFRAWFSTFFGEPRWVMGSDAHGDHDDGHGGVHGPHEMRWWPMNAPLLVLALGALLAGFIGVGSGDSGIDAGWIGHKLHESTAYAPMPAETAYTAAHSSDAAAGDHAHPTLLGMGIHAAVMLLSSLVALTGIAVAWFFHGGGAPVRGEAGAALPAAARNPLARAWYFDELYTALLVFPLRALAYAGMVVDLLVQGLVVLISALPGGLGKVFQPTQQHGRMAGYAAGTAFGVALILIYVVFISPWFAA